MNSISLAKGGSNVPEARQSVVTQVSVAIAGLVLAGYGIALVAYVALGF
jgi:hypothetical protein